MNWINNQSTNPMITQNFEVFQEPSGSADEFEDFSSSLQDREEIVDPPLHQDEVEAAHLLVHFQETEDVNAVKQSAIFISSSKEDNSTSRDLEQASSFKLPSLDEFKTMARQDFIQKRRSKVWSEEENKRFIELKQQQPDLPWKEFATHFPGHTTRQCNNHWKDLEVCLYQEGKLTHPQAEKIDPTAANKKWTQEENKRFIELKRQQPRLPWIDFAQYFPGYTAEQCRGHWHNRLKRKLIIKRALTEDENNDNRISKKPRIELSSPATPATVGGENQNPVMNSSPVVPQELAGIAVPALSHELPIQKTFLSEQKNLLDLSFHHYEVAVNHFQAIQLSNSLLQNVQQEAAQGWASAQMNYQVIKQRLTTEANCLPILEQAQSLIIFCRTNTYYFETIYQHFLSYQTNQESKEWFFSQNTEFANLYFAFLKGNIDEVKFRFFISLKERDHYYKKLNKLFIHLKDTLKEHSPNFKLEYNKFIDDLFFSIEFQFNFLKDNQQNWVSTASSLENTLSRLQEIEVFFQSYFDPIPPNGTEANIIARINNEISLQDFYAKQATLMAVQEEEKQTEESISLHEPSQIPSQTQENFLLNPLFSPLHQDKEKSAPLPTHFQETQDPNTIQSLFYEHIQKRKSETVAKEDIHINPRPGGTKWTQEENKRFIELKQQDPKMFWRDFSKHFPGRTKEQCASHWHSTLKNKQTLTLNEDNFDELMKVAHEPFQTEEDFFSNPLFSPLSDQQY